MYPIFSLPPQLTGAVYHARCLTARKRYQCKNLACASLLGENYKK